MDSEELKDKGGLTDSLLASLAGVAWGSRKNLLELEAELKQ